jgi:hypothetical protein
MPNKTQDFSNLSGDFRNPEPANLAENMKTDSAGTTL